MGAPIGNTNAAKSKLFDAALRRYFTQNPDDLRLCAEKLCEMAKAGDIAAIREVADRLDGKPKQTIAGDPEAPLVPPALQVVFPQPDGQ